MSQVDLTLANHSCHSPLLKQICNLSSGEVGSTTTPTMETAFGGQNYPHILWSLTLWKASARYGHHFVMFSCKVVLVGELSWFKDVQRVYGRCMHRDMSIVSRLRAETMSINESNADKPFKAWRTCDRKLRKAEIFPRIQDIQSICQLLEQEHSSIA